ncbi:hypothetical protein MC885_006620, partial [Smutsia gigantea]
SVSDSASSLGIQVPWGIVAVLWASGRRGSSHWRETSHGKGTIIEVNVTAARFTFKVLLPPVAFPTTLSSSFILPETEKEECGSFEANSSTGNGRSLVSLQPRYLRIWGSPLKERANLELFCGLPKD